MRTHAISAIVNDDALPCQHEMPMTTSTARSTLSHAPSIDGSLVDNLKLPYKGVVLLAIAALVGCSTPPAKNFSGHWKPVNHFQDAPTEIPLNPAYVFYASPMDETLRTMLARWAKDSGRELKYQLPFDVTLYRPVADIHTTDIEGAAAQLNTIYAAQEVFVTASPRQIEVDPVIHSSGDASPSGTAPVVASSTATTDMK
jgi:hypothetical protein